MKKLLLYTCVLSLLWACAKDDDEGTLASTTPFISSLAINNLKTVGVGPSFSGLELIDVDFDSNDKAWISTFDHGLITYDGTDLDSMNTYTTSLPYLSTTSICIDDNDKIYLGSEEGLRIWDGVNWSLFDMNNSNIPNDFILHLERDNNGTIWVFSNTLSSFNGTSFTNYSDPLINDIVHDIAIDANNNIWLATQNNGLIEFDGTTFTSYDASNTSWTITHPIRSLEIDNNQKLWLGGVGFGIATFENTDFVNLSIPDTLIPYDFDIVSGLAVDASNSLWIATGGNGTEGGLIRYKNSKWAYLEATSSQQTVRNLVIDRFDNVWNQGFLSGLSIYNPNGVVKY